MLELAERQVGYDLRVGAGDVLSELEAAAAEAGVPGVWTLTDAQLLTRPADGNMVLLAGGALASPAVEDWRAAWLAAGPHPAAVLDPHETEEAVGRVGRS